MMTRCTQWRIQSCWLITKKREIMEISTSNERHFFLYVETSTLIPFVALAARFELLHRMCLGFTTIIKLWMGPNLLWIFLNDPKYIQKLLLSPVCLEKPFFYKFLRLDSGLISSKCKLLSDFVYAIYSIMCELFLQIANRWCVEGAQEVIELFVQLENPPEFHSNFHR